MKLSMCLAVAVLLFILVLLYLVPPSPSALPPPAIHTVGQVVNIQPGYKSEMTVIGLKFGDGRLFNFQTCRPEARVEIGKIYDIEWGSHLDEWDCYNVTNIFLIK